MEGLVEGNHHHDCVTDWTVTDTAKYITGISRFC